MSAKISINVVPLFVRPLIILSLLLSQVAMGNNVVIWSPGAVGNSISAGSTSSVAIEFGVTEDIRNAKLVVVPELRDFVTIEPSEFASLQAGTKYQVRLELKIPIDTDIGIYDGVLHMRGMNGSKTRNKLHGKLPVLSRPLPIALNITKAIGLGDITFFTDIGGTALFQSESSDGVILQVEGNKDDNGAATNITGLYASVPNVGSHYYDVDSLGRLSRFISPEGHQYSLIYPPLGGEPVLSVVTADGLAQANVALSEVGSQQGADGTAFELNKIVSLSTAPQRQYLPNAESVLLNQQLSTTSTQVNATALVKQCNSMVSGAYVNGVIQNLNNTGLKLHPSFGEVTPGNYATSFPNIFEGGVITPSQYQSICRSTFEPYVQFCSIAGPTAVIALNGGCAALSIAIAATGVGVVTAPGVLKGCLVSMGVIGASCGPTEAGGITTQDICAGISEFLTALSLIDGSNFTTTARKGGVSASETKLLTSNQPQISFSLTLQSGASAEPSIASITTVPIDPAPSERYVGNATFIVSDQCLANAGTNVAIVSVSGTDGYNDSTSCTVSKQNNMCSLSVPGGDAGVRDTITVTLGSVSRVASLVF